MVIATEVTTVRPSLSNVELPLLALQLLTQLRCDPDTVKGYYESCKHELDLHKEENFKEAAKWQQTAEELQSEIAVCSARTNNTVEARHVLELQLEDVSFQLKTAQLRLSQLETQTILEKEVKGISEKISQIWTGILPLVESSETSEALLLQTKENSTAMLRAEDMKKLIVQDFVEILHNNSKLFEAKDAAEQRVQELLGRVKSLEDDLESRSRSVKFFQRYLRNLTLIQDDLLNQHSNITAIVKDHKSEILGIDTSLSDICQNFTSNEEKYKDELMEERLKRLLNGKSKGEKLLEAAKSGNMDDIALLLDFGVDTETRNCYGRTALYLAVESGNLEACELLLDGGANIDPLPTALYDGTPIYRAAEKGYLDIVRLFVERGANLSFKNTGGYTPLKIARNSKHHQVVKYLEEKGAPE